MYEFDWASKERWAKETALGGAALGFRSKLRRDEVARTMLVFWGEHCLECAPPQCYASCPLYVQRDDRKCARLVYGMTRNRDFAGLFDYGVDLRFRRWGKIETVLFGPSVSVARHRTLARMDRVGVSAARGASSALVAISPSRKLHGAFNVLRHKVLGSVPSEGGLEDYDEFVLECCSVESEAFGLVLEWRPDAVTRFRHSFEILPGHNFHRLPIGAFPKREEGAETFLTIYPENDRAARVIFTWLDFVKYQQGGARKQNVGTAAAKPAAKVKCLLWDLDNTLWPGTLIESAAEKLVIPASTIEIIHRMDERGILQSVVSKNDHDAAWAVITRHGLADYFLFPAINWGQKSASVRQIAERLNIGIDSLALVDDSAFEREEVRASLPMARTYSEDQISRLLELDEFDVPITGQSKVRRQSYLVEMYRERAREVHKGDYANFLRSCEMRLRIFVPTTDADRRRCLELIQRSNQLNLSSRRYSAEEFESLLKTPGVLCVGLQCEDRFGNYGIVGFISVDEKGREAIVHDFVISCRVAQKRVEHAFFWWLAERERRRGGDILGAELVLTERNGPLVKVFEDLPFKRLAEQGAGVTLEMALGSPIPMQDVIEVIDEVPR